MGDLITPTHLILLLIIVLVIFGPSKLGDVGSSLGKAIRDFKREMNSDPPPAAAPSQTVASAESKPAEKPVNPS